MGGRSKERYREPRVELPVQFVPGKIGVVTVTYGSGEVLPDFFASLDKQTYLNFVLFSVDNASKDDTVQQLSSYRGCEQIIIANKGNVGVAAGNNQGIRAAIEAGCEYVLLLNNDVVFGPELFQKLVDGIGEHNCQMTTPIIYYHDRPDVIWAAGGRFQWIYGYRCIMYGDAVKDRICSGQDRKVEHTPTCCVLVRREAFARVGLMDERYFVYHDDTDWMLRASKANQSMYCLSNAMMLHKVSSLSGAGSVFQVNYGTRNRAFMIVKFLGRILSIPFSFAYRCCYLWRFISGKDDYQMLKLKLVSWTEGTRIPDNWWPV